MSTFWGVEDRVRSARVFAGDAECICAFNVGCRLRRFNRPANSGPGDCSMMAHVKDTDFPGRLKVNELTKRECTYLSILGSEH